MTYQELMYQHFIAVQQISFTRCFFFCHLQHTNMFSGMRSAWKLLPHTPRYFISMDSYFSKQLHQVELTLYAQNNGFFFLVIQKCILDLNEYILQIVTKKASYLNIFLACGT
jgi:hypothetical protein